MDFHSSTFLSIEERVESNSVISLLEASRSSFTHQHLNNTQQIS